VRESRLLWVPKITPKAIIDKLNDAVVRWLIQTYDSGTLSLGMAYFRANSRSR